MPYREPDPEDPNILVGVSLPADRESIRQMAISFADEFAALGFDEQRLLKLFRTSFYAGAHRAFRILGESEIRKIIRESVRIWGRYRVRVHDNVAKTSRDSDRLVRINRRAASEEDPCPR